MTVSSQIIEVFNAVCEKFGIVIDWASDTVGTYIAELCSRIAQYEIWTSIAWIVGMVFFTIVSIFISRWLWKANGEDSLEYADFSTILSIIVSGVLIFVTAIVIICQVLDIIQAIYLPELTAIEYIKGLIETQGGS